MRDRIIGIASDTQIMMFALKVSGQVSWPWWKVFAPSFLAVAAYLLLDFLAKLELPVAEKNPELPDPLR